MDELLELERAGWSSLCDGTAADFYGDLMTAEGVMVMANGQVMDRDEVVDALRHSPPWASYSIDDPMVVPVDGDTRALVYTGTGNRDEGPPFVGVMTSVYVRRNGDWKLALYQQTAKS
jgi:Domain of unknown function (DUF4440)